MPSASSLVDEYEAEGQIWESARLGDFRGALKARQALDSLRARNRGYEPNPAFGVSISEPELVLAVQLHTDLSTRDWLVRLLLWAGAEGAGVDEFGKRIGAVLLFPGVDVWPDLTEWQAEFLRRSDIPQMWDEILLGPMPALTREEEEFRRLVNPLGFEARLIATRGRALFRLSPTYGLSREALIRGFRELALAGAGSYPAPLATALEAVGSKDLAGACRNAGLKVSGRKGDLISRLLSRPEADLRALLGGDDYASVELPKLGQAWAWSMAFHELLAHTILMSSYRARDIARYATDKIRAIRIVGGSGCSICAPMDQQVVLGRNISTETMPPFHPGCRCAPVPEI